MSLTLYTNPMSRGRMARWMLEEVGQPYDVEIVEYGPSMKSGPYAAINPMGKVPSLVHDGQTVTEVAAICAYLADAFPDAGLGPRSDERGAYYRWLFFAAGPVESAITNRSLGVEIAPEKAGFVGYGSFEKMLQTLEGAVSKNDFVAGDRFTAADVYVGGQIDFGLRFRSIEARPAFTAYKERVTNREAYRRACAADDALLPQEG